MPVVQSLLAMIWQLAGLTRCLHLHDADVRPVHVHDADGCMGILELSASVLAIHAVTCDQVVEIGLGLASLAAGVVLPPRDELPQRLLDLLAAAHGVTSSVAAGRRNTRFGTVPCGSPQAARQHGREPA